MAQSSTEFVLRPFEEADYEYLQDWWGENPPPMTSLPKIGFVVGQHKAVGFLALTDCDFSIITWWMCNPNNTGKESYNALIAYAMGCIEMAKFMKKKFVFCYTHRRSVMRVLESLGFINRNGHLILEVNNG